VYATQPGVWGVECLELEGGRLVWRQGAGSLIRLVARTGDRLILETSDGPAALDPETGKVLWVRQVQQCLTTRICAQPSSIVCLAIHSGRTRGQQSPDGIALSWCNPENGEPLGSCVVEGRGQPAWFLGPVAVGENRQWMALANQQQPARRELLEAVRTGGID
jgi:hypothetical protein